MEEARIPAGIFTDFFKNLSLFLPSSLTADLEIGDYTEGKDFSVEIKTREAFYDFFRCAGVKTKDIQDVLRDKHLTTGVGRLLIGQQGERSEKFTILAELGKGILSMTGFATKHNKNGALL